MGSLSYKNFVVSYVKNLTLQFGSQKKLAEAYNLDPSMVSGMVTGKFIPKPVTFQKYFPDCDMSNVLKPDRPLIIQCKALEDLKKELSKIGYHIEVVKDSEVY